MPRGYGLGRGGYRGRCGLGPGRFARAPRELSLEAAAGGEVYVGPCRCGTGPHAFYRTKSGDLVHARDIGFGRTAPQRTDAEISALRDENRALSDRVKELEAKLREE